MKKSEQFELYYNQLQEIAKEVSEEKVVSFSSLSRFAKSPLSMVQYIWEKRYGEQKDETKAMREGRLFHTMLLEPEIFDAKYKVLSDSIAAPTSKAQKDFCNDVSNGATIVDAFKSNYSIKGKSEEKIEQLAKKLNEDLEKYIHVLKTLSGRELIKEDLFLSFEGVIELSLMGKGKMRSKVMEMREGGEKEKFVEWEYQGFHHRGAIDYNGEKFMADAKLMASISESKIQRVLFDLLLPVQANMYKMAMNELKKDFFWLCFDRKGGNRVVKMGAEVEDWGLNKYLEILKRFQEATNEGLMLAGEEFWSKNKIFIPAVPRYLQED